jgi:hypothetical protein
MEQQQEVNKSCSCSVYCDFDNTPIAIHTWRTHWLAHKGDLKYENDDGPLPNQHTCPLVDGRAVWMVSGAMKIHCVQHLIDT